MRGCKLSRAYLLFQDGRLWVYLPATKAVAKVTAARPPEYWLLERAWRCGTRPMPALNVRGCNEREAGWKVAGLNPGAGKVCHRDISVQTSLTPSIVAYMIVMSVKDDCTHSNVRDVT